VSASTLDKETASKISGKNKVEAAKIVGQIVGERAKKAGIEKVIFDRGGYRYHGRVAAVAEGAREAGIEF
jgi:large subunit ribosomal protein L18